MEGIKPNFNYTLPQPKKVQPKKRNVLKDMSYAGLGISAAVGAASGVGAAIAEKNCQLDMIKNPNKYINPIAETIAKARREIESIIESDKFVNNINRHFGRGARRTDTSHLSSVIDMAEKQINKINEFAVQGKLDKALIKRAGIRAGAGAFATVAAIAAIPIAIVALVKACKDA